MSLEYFLKDRQTILRLRQSSLGTYLDLFAEWLCSAGYGKAVGGLHIRIVGGYSQWIKSNHILVEKLTSEHLQKYLRYRSRKKQCQRDYDASALKQFMSFLQQKGVIAEKIAPEQLDPGKQLVGGFVNYLQRERALAATTIKYYRIWVELFLTDYFAVNANLSMLSAMDIISFVQREAACRGKQAKQITTALRSFLRYARYQGYIEIDLAVAVPAVADRSKGAIPKALSPNQVELFLSKCNHRTAMDHRDYAMFLLLARLGLRAAEVVSLKLDDIDWQAGCITVHGKGSHWTQLPLPTDVGEALVAYLTNGRPSTSIRSIFLRVKAPIAGISPSTVSTQVQRALVLAEIDSPKKGAHQFRHTLATEMLRRGASLAEIGEILRHRSSRATEIYAKVDLDSLNKVALPWPGGEHE
jgi:integrase/recombinase XerD